MPGSGYYKTSYASDLPYMADTLFKRSWLIILAVALCAFPFTTSTYGIHLANLVLLASLGSLSINVLQGTAGLISLGHAAFMGLGAFVTGGMFAQLGVHPLLTIPIGMALGAVAGLITSLPAIRLRGVYLILSTMAMHYIVAFVLGEYETMNKFYSGIALPNIAFGSFQIDSRIKWYFLLLVVVAIVTLFTVNVLRSRVGRAWAAIRDRDIAATTLGVNVAYYKMLVFMFTSAIAALMGSLSALYAGYVTASDYTLWLGISYGIMVVVGGGDSILGSFLGAAFVTLLPYGVEALFKIWTVPIRMEQSLFAVQYGIYGLAILLFLLFEPKGLVGLWSRVRSFFENWPFRYREG